MASQWEVACHPGTCCPEGFILVDKYGNFKADNSDKVTYALKQQNIFKQLVSPWDEKMLRTAMSQAVDSVPQFLIISIRLMDEIQNFRCQVIRSGQRFFIGGCRVSNNLALFPSWAMSA